MVPDLKLRPRFSLEEAARLAREQFGVVATASPLPSYIDQNFLLATEAGERLVLKISHAGTEAAALEMENQAMTRLNQALGATACPRPLPALAGSLLCPLPAAAGQHWLRLVTWVPGCQVAEITPHSPALLRSWGAFMGQVDRALAGWAHPALGRTLDWDMAHAGNLVRRFLPLIRRPERRALLEHFLARFEDGVMPAWPGLRQGAIHNDGNSHNLLASRTPTLEMAASGIVDFGDMVQSPIVVETAVSAAYAMLEKPDPLGAAAQVLAGYHSANPLVEEELALIYDLIAMRLCASVAKAAHHQREEPDNPYLTISQGPAWAALENWAQIHPNLALASMRHACGLEPVPRGAKVAAWLRAHGGDMGPLLPLDLRQAHVFDLSPGSLEMGLLPPLDRPEQLQQWVAERLAQTGASAGVGRYAEPRLIYREARFVRQGNDGPRRRTLHLGLDLFVPAGTPVFAPLPGLLHSFAGNPGPQEYGPTLLLQHSVEEGRLSFFTLYGHLSKSSLDGLAAGQAVAQGEQIGTVGGMEENGGWPPHLHLQLVSDMLGHEGEFPGVADPEEEAVWLALCPDPNLVARVPAERFPPPPLAPAALAQRRATRLAPSLSLAYAPEPLHIVRGQGQFLYDEMGRAYLDGVNNVCHVGHCHPRVVEAARRQMAVLNSNTRYLHQNLVTLAERLCATLPPALSVCFFLNSGSEANDLALRLARTATGQQDVLVLDGAYHGNLTSLIAISPYKFDGPGGGGAPSFVHVLPMPDGYAGIHRGHDEESAAAYAAHVAPVLARLQAQGRAPAAFIAESFLGCGGQIELPPGYLGHVYRQVRAAGGLCIADEVQVGFGRLGSAFWGFQSQGVVPDIVTMGKPMGNGHPLAAVVTRPQIAAAFANGMEYFNTFGGNPVSCAVGLAVLDVIQEEGLQQRAASVGAQLKAGLESLAERRPLIGQVRGQGLFLGVELVRDRQSRAPAAAEAAYVVRRLKQLGILLSTDGPRHNVLKIKPPLVFNQADAARLVAALDRVLGETGVQP